jgi:excisionase family DNA binding protein
MPDNLNELLRRLKGQSDEPLDASEVSEILGVSISTIYRYANDGKLGAKKEGGKWLFDRKMVIDHLQGSVRPNINECRVPVSIAQFRALSNSEPNSVGQCPFLKVFPSDFTQDDIRAVAASLVSYFFDRDLTITTKSWQDYILHQVAMQSAFEELLSQRIETHREAPLTAVLKVQYQNFPDVQLNAEQIAEIESWKVNLKAEEVTTELIAERVLTITNAPIKVGDLRPRDMLAASEEARRRLATLDRDRLVRIVEGVVASLIAAGLFEFIVWALRHVPFTFAPYAEAQVYEIEGVALRATHKWRPKALAALKPHGLTSTQQELLLGFVVHGLVLLSYYGADLPADPLIGQHERKKAQLERLLSPSLKQLTGRD